MIEVDYQEGDAFAAGIEEYRFLETPSLWLHSSQLFIGKMTASFRIRIEYEKK